MNPSSSAADGRPVMTRRRAMLEGKGNPGEGPFLVDPNSPREPRDIVVENEVMAKVEVKEEPDEEGGLEAQVETHQENAPARKRVKVEDDDTGEMVIVEDELDIPMDFVYVTEDQDQGIEQGNDDTVSLPSEVDDAMAHDADDTTTEITGVVPPATKVNEVSSEVDDAMAHDVDDTIPPESDDVVPLSPEVDNEEPPAPKGDDAVPPSASDIEAVVLQNEKVFEELSNLSSLLDTLSIQSGKATAEDEDPIAFKSTSCQTGGDEEDNDVFQTKILELFPEVIKVYWEKYARFQPNSQELLNLKCRLACKIWKEGMDKVLQGEYTQLKNIHPNVTIPHGDVVGTVEIVDQVLEAYKNVDLAVCPFPPRVLEIRDQNTTQTGQQMSLSRATILQFVKKFGSGLKEFKFCGIMGKKKLHQYTSGTDWYLTVVGKWIARMPNLEKLNMRNSLDEDVHFSLASSKVQELSDELALYAILFPKLRNLKSLEERLMPFSIITGAFLVNSHVMHVHCFSNCVNDHQGRLKEGLNFPKLRSISYTDDYHVFQLNPASIFRRVEKLELDNSANCYFYLDLSWAFRFVQHFNEEKLTSLHFKFPNCIINSSLGQVNVSHGMRTQIERLAMPKLKELSITFFQGDGIQPFISFSWTEAIIIKMCSDLTSLEKLKIVAYRIEEIKWKENVRELKMCRIKHLLRTRLVNRLMGMLSNLKLVEIQPALSEYAGVTVMKSLTFIREASRE